MRPAVGPAWSGSRSSPLYPRHLAEKILTSRSALEGERKKACLDSLVESLPTARLLLLVNYCPEHQHGTEIRLGLAAATERNAWGHRAPWLRLEAEVLAQGDPAGARDRLEEALALAAELGMRPEVAHCHLGLGKLDRRTGKREKGREHLSTATAMYSDMGMRFWLEQAEAELC